MHISFAFLLFFFSKSCCKYNLNTILFRDIKKCKNVLFQEALLMDLPIFYEPIKQLIVIFRLLHMSAAALSLQSRLAEGEVQGRGRASVNFLC